MKLEAWIEQDSLKREKVKSAIKELENLTPREWLLLKQATTLSFELHPETCVVNKTNSKYDEYIGRGSRWGNPFEIGKDGDREEVCAKYFGYLMNSPELLAALPSLVGKKLGCYCHPKLCHGDIIIHVMRLREII